MRRAFTEEQDKEIAVRYRAGESSVQLARSLGSGHWAVLSALEREGVDRRPPGARGGALAPKWKGGRIKTETGYVLAWISDEELPALARANGRYVLEHRLVMARHLRRALGRHETVHHKNGDRSDNRLANLELRVGSHGNGATEPHCTTCNCFP